MCSAHPKYFMPRLSRAAAEILLYPLTAQPAPLPWSCRSWASGTSRGCHLDCRCSAVLRTRNKLTLHLFQFLLHALELLGQLITCRLARAGGKCDAGSCTPTTTQPQHSPSPGRALQPIQHSKPNTLGTTARAHPSQEWCLAKEPL